jgi:NAD+ synthase
VIVALSGGVDSAVCVALSVRAIGAENVFGLMLPERESNPLSLTLAIDFAERLGIRYDIQDITHVLEAVGCYARRDQAILRAVPAYGTGWSCKLALTGAGLADDGLPVTLLIVEDPAGRQTRIRLRAAEYRQVVAATNYKQRVRAMIAYHHADLLHYAVVGTPNRLEFDQGFFVKGGDGLADIKPIAHLYKSQVYALAEVLEIPTAIRNRTPTSDTFPLAQTQEEFYFGMPTNVLDQLLFALNESLPAAYVAESLGISESRVHRVWNQLRQKREAADYLHHHPLLAKSVDHHTTGGSQ